MGPRRCAYGSFDVRPGGSRVREAQALPWTNVVDVLPCSCRPPPARLSASMSAMYIVGMTQLTVSSVRLTGLVATTAVTVHAGGEDAPLPPAHVEQITSVTNPYVKHCTKLNKR